jgi:hypothetical protein
MHDQTSKDSSPRSQRLDKRRRNIRRFARRDIESCNGTRAGGAAHRISVAVALKNYAASRAYIVGDYHIVKGGVVVEGGAPGVGKSRGLIALAVSGATGNEWFGYKIHRKFKTLIVQTENGEFRLSAILPNWIAMRSRILFAFVRRRLTGFVFRERIFENNLPTSSLISCQTWLGLTRGTQ